MTSTFNNSTDLLTPTPFTLQNIIQLPITPSDDHQPKLDENTLIANITKDAANAAQENRSGSARANDGSLTSTVNDSYFPAASKTSTFEPVPTSYSNTVPLDKSENSTNLDSDINNEIQKDMKSLIEEIKRPVTPGHPITPTSTYTAGTFPPSRKTSVHFTNDDVPLTNSEQHLSSPRPTTPDQTRRKSSDIRASNEPILTSNEKPFDEQSPSTIAQGNDTSSSDDYFGIKSRSPNENNTDSTINVPQRLPQVHESSSSDDFFGMTPSSARRDDSQKVDKLATDDEQNVLKKDPDETTHFQTTKSREPSAGSRRLSDVQASNERTSTSDEKPFDRQPPSTIAQRNDSSSSDDYFGIKSKSPNENNTDSTINVPQRLPQVHESSSSDDFFGMTPSSAHKDDSQKVDKLATDDEQQALKKEPDETTTKPRIPSAASQKSAQIDTERNQLNEKRSSIADIQNGDISTNARRYSSTNNEGHTSPPASPIVHPTSSTPDDQTTRIQSAKIPSRVTSPQVRENVVTTNRSRPQSAVQQQTQEPETLPVTRSRPQSGVNQQSAETGQENPQINGETMIVNQSRPHSLTDNESRKILSPTTSPQQTNEETVVNRSRPQSGVQQQNKVSSRITSPQQTNDEPTTQTRRESVVHDSGKRPSGTISPHQTNNEITATTYTPPHSGAEDEIRKTPSRTTSPQQSRSRPQSAVQQQNKVPSRVTSPQQTNDEPTTQTRRESVVHDSNKRPSSTTSPQSEVQQQNKVSSRITSPQQTNDEPTTQTRRESVVHDSNKRPSSTTSPQSEVQQQNKVPSRVTSPQQTNDEPTTQTRRESVVHDSGKRPSGTISPHQTNNEITATTYTPPHSGAEDETRKTPSRTTSPQQSRSRPQSAVQQQNKVPSRVTSPQQTNDEPTTQTRRESVVHDSNKRPSSTTSPQSEVQQQNKVPSRVTSPQQTNDEPTTQTRRESVVHDSGKRPSGTISPHQTNNEITATTYTPPHSGAEDETRKTPSRTTSPQQSRSRPQSAVQQQNKVSSRVTSPQQPEHTESAHQQPKFVSDSETTDFIKAGEQLEIPDINSLDANLAAKNLAVMNPLKRNSISNEEERPVVIVKQPSRRSSQASDQQKQSNNDQTTPRASPTNFIPDKNTENQSSDSITDQEKIKAVSSTDSRKHSIGDRPRNVDNDDNDARPSSRRGSVAQEPNVKHHNRTSSNVSAQRLLDNEQDSGSGRDDNQDKKTLSQISSQQKQPESLRIDHSRTPSNVSNQSDRQKTNVSPISSKKDDDQKLSGSRTQSSISNDKVIDGDTVIPPRDDQQLIPSASRRSSKIDNKPEQERSLQPSSRKSSVVQQSEVKPRSAIKHDATESDSANYRAPAASIRNDFPLSDTDNYLNDQRRVSETSTSTRQFQRQSSARQQDERKSATSGGEKVYEKVTTEPFVEPSKQRQSAQSTKKRTSITTDSEHESQKLPLINQQQNQEKRRTSITQKHQEQGSSDQKRHHIPPSPATRKENNRTLPRHSQDLKTPTSDEDIENIPAYLRAVKIPPLNLDETMPDNRPLSPSVQQIAERNQSQEQKRIKKKSGIKTKTEHALEDVQKKVDHLLHPKKRRSSSADSHIPLADGHSVGSTSGKDTDFDNTRKMRSKKHDASTATERDEYFYRSYQQQQQRNFFDEQELLSTKPVKTIKPQSERRRKELVATPGTGSDTTAIVHKTARSYKDDTTPVNVNVTVVVKKVQGGDSLTPDVQIEKSSTKPKLSRSKKVEQTVDTTPTSTPALDQRQEINNQKKTEDEQHQKVDESPSQQPLFEPVQKKSVTSHQDQPEPLVVTEIKRPQSIEQKSHDTNDLFSRHHQDERHVQSDSEQFVTAKQQKRRRPKRISRTTQTYDRVFRHMFKEEQQQLRYTSDTEKQIQTRKSALRPRKKSPKKHFPLYLSADTFRVEDLIPKQFHQPRRNLSKSSTLGRSLSPQGGKVLILRPTLPLHHSDAVNVHRVCLQYAIDLQPTKNQLNLSSRDKQQQNQSSNNNSSLPMLATNSKSAVKRSENNKNSLPAIEHDQHISHHRGGAV
ncbi:unnamed protein product [Didymodactylos carnosus]|uniref:Uncharacterized protein n=1 Tax=Didymodactylos carnosus TaxID=1234261 RepID=A0A813XWV6_9BILA|nr:unnamed protein product [Didymodactylos carnosus]CAF3658447.1 unnamed protein product [Didymodactylos carnosus]